MTRCKINWLTSSTSFILLRIPSNKACKATWKINATNLMVNKFKLFQGGCFRLRSFYWLTTWSNIFITIRRKCRTNSSTWEFCFRSCLIDFLNLKWPSPSPQKSNGRPIAGGKGDEMPSRLRPTYCHFSTYKLLRTI